jgi:hypothetical protein
VVLSALKSQRCKVTAATIAGSSMREPAAGREAAAGGFTGPGRPAVHAASVSATPGTTPQLTRRLIISLSVHAQLEQCRHRQPIRS